MHLEYSVELKLNWQPNGLKSVYGNKPGQGQRCKQYQSSLAPLLPCSNLLQQHGSFVASQWLSLFLLLFIFSVFWGYWEITQSITCFLLVFTYLTLLNEVPPWAHINISILLLILSLAYSPCFTFHPTLYDCLKDYIIYSLTFLCFLLLAPEHRM